MILEELLPNRDSKMRRFCNYFLTLFNQKKLNPFTQFVHSKTLKRVKMHVRLKMQYFTKGVKAQVNDEKARTKRKRKDRKSKEIKGEVKKEEPKAQKLPQTQSISKLTQHEVTVVPKVQKAEKSKEEKKRGEGQSRPMTKSNSRKHTNSSIHQPDNMDEGVEDHLSNFRSS